MSSGDDGNCLPVRPHDSRANDIGPQDRHATARELSHDVARRVPVTVPTTDRHEREARADRVEQRPAGTGSTAVVADFQDIST